MNKMWRIIKYEYKRQVLRKRFLVAMLSVPAWVLLMMVIAVAAVLLSSNNTPIGYVDQSGFLAHPIQLKQTEGDPFKDVEVVAFPDEASARKALDSKKIQGYYLLPPDFLETRSAKLVYLEEPSSSVRGTFNSFLRRNLLGGEPETVAQRVTGGPSMAIVATEDQRSMQTNEWFKTVAPIAGGVLLIMAVFSSGGYLMQIVVEEKENRTMEILTTSVSPMQIMGGKIIAMIGVGLTQVAAWSLLPVLFVSIAAIYIPTLRNAIEWGTFGMIFLLIIPTFVMISALMAAVGATVTDRQEGQQVTGLITLPVMIPYMLTAVIMTNPGSPIALFLSFFPLTSALTILLRMGFGSVPVWQSALAVAILVISAAGSLWLAGRIFRLGMLRYGQRLRWKDIFLSFRRAE